MKQKILVHLITVMIQSAEAEMSRMKQVDPNQTAPKEQADQGLHCCHFTAIV